MGRGFRVHSLLPARDRVCLILSISQVVLPATSSLKSLVSLKRYPVGGDADYRHFFIEIHYDNPEMKLGRYFGNIFWFQMSVWLCCFHLGFIDSMGLRFHMTKNLRKNELGILTVGTDSTDSAITIPPGIEGYEITGHCHNRCTELVNSWSKPQSSQNAILMTTIL